MAQQDSTFSLAKVFEERAREIDTERRSVKDLTAPDVSFENEPIRHHVIEAEGRPAYIVEMQGKKLLRSLTADSVEGLEILQHSQPGVLFPIVTPPSAPDETETEIERALSNTQEIAAVSGR